MTQMTQTQTAQLGDLLLVEDNAQVQLNNKNILERHGYSVRLAMNLAEARQLFAQHQPDVMILDITLPDGSGLDYLQELRKTSRVPVLLLTALGTSENASAGLDAGADDYLAKPYNLKEFRARVDALIRRATRVPQTVTRGLLTLDVVASQAFLAGKDMLLTKKEFSMLLLLIQHQGETLSAVYLYQKVWKQSLCGDDSALKNTVYKLRKKLADSGFEIINERGEGYCFIGV